MGNKPTQEELLEKMDRYQKILIESFPRITGGTDLIHETIRQFFIQIKEIVEGHYNSVHVEMHDGTKIVYKGQQKPEKKTVTRGWVNVQAAELMANINDLAGKVGVLQILREVLPEILKEAGVMVTK